MLTINPGERTRTVQFEFNERGRGPKLFEVTRFFDQGQVLNLQISGSSCMGAPVDGSLELLPNGRASISKPDEIEKTHAGIVQTLSLYSIAGTGNDLSAGCVLGHWSIPVWH